MNWSELLAHVGPAVLKTANVASAVIPLAIHAMREAQSLPGASGPKKKAHVMALITDGVTALNEARGKQVLDLQATRDAVSDGIDTTIAAINLVTQRHPA